MSLKPFDYTNKDYEGFRQSMIEEIPKKMPEWTDRSTNDPGIVILELLAKQLDNNAYYIDRVANEAYLPSATQRKSVIDACRGIGYTLSWQTASRHYQVFQFAPQASDIIIEKGTQVTTIGSQIEDAVIFELLEDLIIPAGKTGLEQDADGNYLYQVEIEHGESVQEELLGVVSEEVPNMRFPLAYEAVLKDSILLGVQERNRPSRIVWTQVSDFIGSVQDSEHFVAEMDEYDKVSLLFGNGASGRIPPIESSIYVSYKVGGGNEGNVGANTITEFKGSVTGFIQTFNPYGPHLYGTEKESIEEAKWRGPASLKMLERFVTLDDYEVGVRLFVPGIAMSKAINVDGDVNLIVVPQDGVYPSEALKEEILRIIEDKKVIFTRVILLDPIYYDFDIDMDVELRKHQDQEAIEFEIRESLAEKYELSKQCFGGAIKIGQIYHTVFDIEGVKNVSVNSPSANIPVMDSTIARLRNITINWV